MKFPVAPRRLALAFTSLALANSSYGAIVASTQESATVAFASTTWASQVAANDLINNGSAALAGKTLSANFFGPNGSNDGLATQGSSTENTFFYLGNNQFPATAQFDLNVSLPANQYGYDITSIQSFMGWATVSQAQANQTYIVSVSLVGSSAYNDIATVSYRPFADVDGGNYESHVVLTQNNGSGVLVSNVDSIRFTFSSPLAPTTGVSNGAGTVEGTVIRELDVFGQASVPEPSSALLGGLGALALLRRRRA